jgi:hypothetical protein
MRGTLFARGKRYAEKGDRRKVTDITCYSEGRCLLIRLSWFDKIGEAIRG